MSVSRDEHSVQIGSSTVTVKGTTGPVHATWALLIDGAEADSAKAAGDFLLRGRLGDGSTVDAAVHQSLLGPTEVIVLHGDDEVGRFTGFVA